MKPLPISILTLLMFSILTQCQSKQNENAKEGSRTDTNKQQEKAEQEPEEPHTNPALKAEGQVLLTYVNCDDCGFRFIKDGDYGAVTFYGYIQMKNTSGQMIREMALEMPLSIEYQSGAISHIQIKPGTNGSYNYIGGLKGKWLKPENTKTSLRMQYAYITDWQPGAIKTFAFYAGMPANKVTGEAPFQRTPESLTLEPRMPKFRSLDYEFNGKSLSGINVKSLWLETQKQLGYRE